MADNSEPPVDSSDVQRFLDGWLTFRTAVNEHYSPTSSTELLDRVTQHLGTEPATLETASTTVPATDAVNQDIAFAALDPDAAVLGLDPNLSSMGRNVTLQTLLSSQPYVSNHIMPITWIDRPIDVETTRACPAAAVRLMTVEGQPVIAGLWTDERMGRGDAEPLRLEVLAADVELAKRVIHRLAELRTELNVYRGKVLGFNFSEYGSFGLEFVAIPPVARGELILPDDDLAAIERHTIRLSERSEELRERGRHLKRGLLLYGPPGTGKTHTVSYLIGAMPDRTTIILQGPSAGAIGQAAAIARAFPPATIVIEDVDLIAYDRGMGPFGENPMMFQLLNEMDGFADDSDLLFVLTTNRADVLEPALASRPGRIDQAIEVAKPDHDARVRLLELYFVGVEHSVSSFADAADQIDGVTASFVKELCRRAVMDALDNDRIIDDAHLSRTIEDLLERSAPVVLRSLGSGAGDITDEMGPPGNFGGPPGGLDFEF